MVDANILFKLGAPANVQTAMQSAAQAQGTLNELAQMPIRNRLLEAQAQGADLQNQKTARAIKDEDAMFVLRDVALDAMDVIPIIKRGNMAEFSAFMDGRIRKIEGRDGDATESRAFKEQIESGLMSPDVALERLQGAVEKARQAGVLEGASGRGIRPGFVGSPQRVTENGQNYLTGLYQDEYGNVTEKRVPVSGNFVMSAPSVQDIGGVKTIIDANTGRAALPTLQQPIDGQAPTGNIPPPTPIDAAMTAQNAATVEGGKEAGKQAIQMSGDALKKLPDVRRAISNIDQAIAAVDKGANTGVIASKFPSVTAASIELDNLRGSMGLDVIAGTTFGALSEAELGFALDTALPTRLSGPELKAWLTRKKEAQGKLAKELEEAAIYLGKPGNTPAGWLEMKRNQQGRGGDQTKTSSAQKIQAPSGAIKFLQANPTPEIKTQFKQKYGYLPEGM